MREDKKDINHDKEFSENVDRMLAGEQTELHAASDEDYRTAVEFAQNLIGQRADASPAFKARLKERLLSRLTEKENGRKTGKGRIRDLLGSLWPHQPVWQKALAIVLIVAMIIGTGSIVLSGRVPSMTSTSWDVVSGKAYAATTEVTSFHFYQYHTTTDWYESIKVFEDEGQDRIEGDFLAPDRLRWLLKIKNDHTMEEWNISEWRIIGDNVYKWDFHTDSWSVQNQAQYWQKQVDIFYELTQPDSLAERLKNLEDVEELPNEVIDGVNCLHYKGKLDLLGSLREEMEKEIRPMMREHLQRRIDAVEQSEVTATTEIWIGKNDYRVRQERNTTYKFNASKRNGIDYNIPVPDDAIITRVETMTSRFSGFNKPITIEAPELPDSDWYTMPPVTAESMRGVWGSSWSDVFAVGDYGMTIAYGGWQRITSEQLNGVWGTSPVDVFAIGESGTIFHFNGIDWSTMSSGTSLNLRDVWGTSSSDVFAVGWDGIILHYDGNSWSEMNSSTTAGLMDVWGSSSTDVFAVGWDGIILHYDGSSWSEMNSGTTAGLMGVWGSSSTDVFAVGWDGTILHYNGSSWSEMSSGTAVRLMDVWGSSSTDVFAVGWEGIILHYDGNSWRMMKSGTTVGLMAVWGSSFTDVYAVGDNGKILHYGG